MEVTRQQFHALRLLAGIILSANDLRVRLRTAKIRKGKLQFHVMMCSLENRGFVRGHQSGTMSSDGTTSEKTSYELTALGFQQYRSGRETFARK